MADDLYSELEILRAVHFAADKHRDQRRKDAESSPYINHPIEVAETLARVGGISDLAALQAAVLHDTIEDTETSVDELEEAFGAEVRDLVQEVTDDKSLSKQERKQRQIEHAPHLSDRAKMIKLADKICNTRDVARAPPSNWSMQRRSDYLDWSEAVVAGCRGVNEHLERYFDEVLVRARAVMGTAKFLG
jgi:guanosine-3',5'-bis(diphosphate) 3'-pyrophosphohydrolase